jgi:hypothetical protein
MLPRFVQALAARARCRVPRPRAEPAHQAAGTSLTANRDAPCGSQIGRAQFDPPFGAVSRKLGLAG